MSHSWEVKEGKQTHYLSISGGEVTIGDHWGSGHTDNAGVYSFDEMKDGGWDKHIERIFGADVLVQVKTAIGAITAAPKTKPAPPAGSSVPGVRPPADIPFPEFD